FFQAEDGIRDGHVTGVQTCALPILTTLTPSPNPSTFGQTVTLTASVNIPNATGLVTFKDGANLIGTAVLNSGSGSINTNSLAVRSEERRVGKEGRSRWVQ